VITTRVGLAVICSVFGWLVARFQEICTSIGRTREQENERIKQRDDPADEWGETGRLFIFWIEMCVAIVSSYSDDLVDDFVGHHVDPEHGGWLENSGIVGTVRTKDTGKAERRGKAETSDGEQTKQGPGSRAAFGLRVQT
jgi:hypothetical protein